MLNVNPAEAPQYVFSAREHARLEIYRSAVRAGFYNESLSKAGAVRAAIRQEHAHGLGSDLQSAHH
jgi:hypothetical protein